MLAIGSRRVHVVDRVELAAALAGVAEELEARRLSGDRLLYLARPARRRPHAADRDRGAGDPAGPVRLEQRRRRRDREIAVPPGELDEGIGVLLAPLREAHRG